jgi:hypothetical protein
MARSRVELFEQIRRDRRVGGLSVRELADNRHVHRRTVRQALASAVPPPRKAYARRTRPAIDAYVEVIDSWLLANRDVPRKQRHTARRVWQRLVAEHGATCTEVTVSRYVARRRVELGLDRVQVAVPQTHPPGAEAGGRPSASSTPRSPGRWSRRECSRCGFPIAGKAFHVALATQAQEAFLEGHVLAFEYFGAVPAHGRHQQQPVNLKLAPALNLASNARDMLVMRRLPDGDKDQRRRGANCRARAQTTCPLRPIGRPPGGPGNLTLNNPEFPESSRASVDPVPGPSCSIYASSAI